MLYRAPCLTQVISTASRYLKAIVVCERSHFAFSFKHLISPSVWLIPGGGCLPGEDDGNAWDPSPICDLIPGVNEFPLCRFGHSDRRCFCSLVLCYPSQMFPPGNWVICLYQIAFYWWNISEHIQLDCQSYCKKTYTQLGGSKYHLHFLDFIKRLHTCFERLAQDNQVSQ